MLRRVAIFVATLVAASLVIFLLVQALPGDVAQATLGLGAKPEAVAALRHEWGLDKPLPLRYVEWVGGLLHGDFGVSYLTGQSVTSQIAPRLAVTAWLVGLSIPLSAGLALVIGAAAAMWRRRWQGAAVTLLSQIGLAMPAFFAATLAVIVFAVELGWLPANGYVPLRGRRGWNTGGWLAHMVLPVAAIVVVQTGLLVRYVRAGFIDVLTQDYYRTARAIGWTRWGGLMRHGVRNVATSLVTVVGLQVSSLFVGAILVEQVFALPGLGTLLVAAVASRDLLVVQGVVMLLVFVVLTVNFLVDLAYLALDPRLRQEAA